MAGACEGEHSPSCTSQPDQSHDDQEAACCFICLGTEGTLGTPCACPRPVHLHCLARWQLQQAGREEERKCRFCHEDYGDWRAQFTPEDDLQPATPVMAVTVRGRVHKLKVFPGAEGKAIFKQQVRQLLGYDSSTEFDVVFECKVPVSGEKVQLNGFDAFDAATHCASVSAARRLARKRAQQPAHQHHHQQQPQQQRSQLTQMQRTSQTPQQQAAQGALGAATAAAHAASSSSNSADSSSARECNTGWLPLPPPLRRMLSGRSSGAPAAPVPGGTFAAAPAAMEGLPPPATRSLSGVSMDAAVSGVALDEPTGFDWRQQQRSNSGQTGAGAGTATGAERPVACSRGRPGHCRQHRIVRTVRRLLHLR